MPETIKYGSVLVGFALLYAGRRQIKRGSAGWNNGEGLAPGRAGDLEAPGGELLRHHKRPLAERRTKYHACLLRSRRRPEPDQGQEGRHHRLRQPGPRPRAQSARQRRQGGGGGAAQDLRRRQKGRGREVQGHGGGGSRQMGRRDDDADARRIAGRHLSRPPRRQHEARRGADVRARPQRAFQPDRAARRPRRADDRAERPRPHRALGISARRRRALPGGDPQGRLRQRPRSRPVLCLGDRRRPRRHHRDHVQGRMRDRPVRRADRAVRRRGRADEGGLRDAVSRPATRPRWPISNASTR